MRETVVQEVVAQDMQFPLLFVAADATRACIILLVERTRAVMADKGSHTKTVSQHNVHRSSLPVFAPTITHAYAEN